MRVANPNLFVISGGPGTGKTTLLEELESLGYPHAPEVAREIIREQVQSGGTALPWGDREAYTELMLQRSIDSFREHTPAVKPVFSDRGIPDLLGYARLIGLRDTRAIEAACQTVPVCADRLFGAALGGDLPDRQRAERAGLRRGGAHV